MARNRRRKDERRGHSNSGPAVVPRGTLFGPPDHLSFEILLAVVQR